MTIKLTDTQRKVLEDCVIDADEWVANAITNYGEELASEFLLEKVEKRQSDYEARLAAGNYRNRKQRDLDGLQAMRDNPKMDERVRSLYARQAADLENGIKPVRLSGLRSRRPRRRSRGTT